jgi:hypothetical protein
MQVIVNFRREKVKLFWRTIGPELAVVTACSQMIAMVVIFWRWYQFGSVPPISQQDISEFVRVPFQYEMSGWWELLFFWLWSLLLYAVSVSRHLKRQLGLAMKIVFILLIIILGIYFFQEYRSMLYGLIISLFLIIMPPILLLVNFLWRKAKWLSSSDDLSD